MKLHNNEKGIVTIVVTVLVLVVITITTIGMGQLARREQRQAVDKQLSVQALMAAESAINDALLDIKNEVAAGRPVPTRTQCSDPRAISTSPPDLRLPAAVSAAIFGGTTVSSKYTCVLVDDSPASLEYAQVNTDSSVVADITTPLASGPASRLVVGWESVNGGGNFRSGLAECNSLPKAANWDSGPLLKVDITNMELAPNLTRPELMNSTATYYLNPCEDTAYTSSTYGIQAFSPGVNNVSNGLVVSGRCDSAPAAHNRNNNQPLRCNAHITFSPTTRHILVRAKPVYAAARVSVYALDPSGNPLRMRGAQTVIDTTGQSNDVVRRTQVRVSNKTPYLYAIESAAGVCKRIVAIEQPNSTIHTMPRAGLPSEDIAVCDPRNTTP